MKIFGRESTVDLENESVIQKILHEARSKTELLKNTPIHQIIKTLSLVGQQFAEGTEIYHEALKILNEDSSFHPQENQRTLNLLPHLLSEAELWHRLVCELGDPALLDRFVTIKPFAGKIRAEPLGVVLHITAGNVFLSSIDSLIQGFLTKNVSLLKPSSQNRRFPELVAQAFSQADPQNIVSDKFAILPFQGGNQKIQVPLLQGVDGVIAWGGAESVLSLKKDLPLGTRFLEFGPKISFQVLSLSGLLARDNEELMQSLASEICGWDQSACASPQNLFLESGIDVSQLMTELGKAMEQYPLRRGLVSADEHLEILKEKSRAQIYTHLHQSSMVEGNDFLLFHEPKPGLRPSALCRTLILKTYTSLDDLCSQVLIHQRFLQSCSLSVSDSEREQYTQKLSSTGVKRFCEPGKILVGLSGAPHDGKLPLRELVSFVSDEQKTDLIAFANECLRTVPYFSELSLGTIKSLEELPLTDKSIFSDYSPHKSPKLLRSPLEPGFYFASGGTTGNPKYTYYSNKEFDSVALMLSQSYKMNGLLEGATVANLFVAGNLWSSFLAVHKALEYSSVRQLPLGGLADEELILSTLKNFGPQALFGLPSLLVSLAHKAIKSKQSFYISHIFYAGEHINSSQKKLLTQAFGSTVFVSAGYASVDAGPIGWQCPYLNHAEHHLYSDWVHLEIVDEEAVVSSLLKRNMPVLRYRTGDRVQWVPKTGCPCGSTDKIFQLLDRVDNTFRFLASSISYDEVATALGTNQEIQIILHNQPDDTMEILLTEPPVHQALELLYHQLEDLNRTVSFAEFASHCQIKTVDPSQIFRNPRTGKTPKVRDLRV